jgi:uncharacterized protein (TIGR03086 family)
MGGDDIGSSDVPIRNARRRRASVDPLDAVEAGQRAVIERLKLVRDEHWQLPTTPCRSWTVFGLVNHVVASNRTYVLLLSGATREEAVIAFCAEAMDADLVEAYSTAAQAVITGLRAPGALELTYPHPFQDMTGHELAGWRVVDDMLHAWDLARAIGADEHLPPDAVVAMWEVLEPVIPYMGHFGTFGPGASGTVDASTELQVRVLDATGRRP